MVRALLDGSKTQTRRIVKQLDPAQGAVTAGNDGKPMRVCWAFGGPVIQCPYGIPGDRLWVRENWYCDDYRVQKGPYLEVDGARDLTVYFADNPRPYEAEQPVWRPSIHMPRWACRILLEVVSVRVERLNDCSEADAKAEGIKRIKDGFERWHPCPTDTQHEGLTRDPVLSYRGLWESINGAGSWDANPWVWVVEFKRVLP
jgi:hypothetical protein